MKVSRADFERETIPDDSPDTSYLEQDGFEDRMRAYRRGDFGFIGVRAAIDLDIPTKQGGIIGQRITTPGLWGIEDDSDEDYLREVYEEECAQLVEMLETLGVTVEE